MAIVPSIKLICQLFWTDDPANILKFCNTATKKAIQGDFFW